MNPVLMNLVFHESCIIVLVDYFALKLLKDVNNPISQKRDIDLSHLLFRSCARWFGAR